MLRTCTWAHRSASLLLIQEKLDRGAAESCKSGSTWLETWMSWSFSSQHGLSPKCLLLHAQTRDSKFVLSQCAAADKGSSSSKAKLPRVNCKAYPPLAFRRHSKLPESISRFTDLLRSTKTCHKLLTDSTRTHDFRKQNWLSESPTTHPMCTWT